ncbi:hypothetical protein [Adhaeribacter pallidiroseus]|uniref:Uncharacterized protein n=1 Tax=Adhaeribacter pallidiroseus TaxID=2072847 RepID=A0A369QJ72_9BACT|nr:hypothetical protein [Adhaeribacter pallidiroseus]RDC63276.1 hypothetical protein AHMF7616_01878 [Adhaeribacter pallidiroseus]
MESVIEAGENFYVLRDAQAVVEFSGGTRKDNLFAEKNITTSGGWKVAKWGADNLKPQNMLHLVYGNHIKPQLIYTSRDFLLGSRLSIFERKIVTNPTTGKNEIALEPVINPQLEDWLEETDADNYMRSAAYNLEFAHNVFTSFSLDTSSNLTLKSWDCTDVRAAQMLAKQQNIEQYLLHPDWANYKESDLANLPAFDRINPTKFGDFMYHGRDRVPGQPYYDVPPWWGTEEWTRVSNLIPNFHKSGLKNGYNIKYHIKIPANYFDQFKTNDEKKKEETRLMGVMNEMLAGTENADKAFVSKFLVDANGKQIPGWEILPIENKMSDDAYTNVNNQSNIAHTSGHGIDPSLAGIDTGGKLGGSGSEKRISYQLHIALRTPNKRKILLEPFNKVAKPILKWWPREQFIGFEDISLTTLDQNPTGQQKTVNNNQ